MRQGKLFRILLVLLVTFRLVASFGVHRPLPCPSAKLPILWKRCDNKSKLYSSAVTTTTTTTTTAHPSAPKELGKVQGILVKCLMVLFVTSMCFALPLTLLPQRFMRNRGWIGKKRSERWAYFTGSFCARWLLRIFPFCRVRVVRDPQDDTLTRPSESSAVWVANHTSMLDVFLLLGFDHLVRDGGHKRRLAKIIYWKQLEDHPVIKLIFTQCGFIPVEMEANKAGETNQYNPSSFRSLVTLSREAMVDDGCDMGILPEGQLNPHPEKGLLPVFSGAYTLARMAKQRPIRIMAMHGAHFLWHPLHQNNMLGGGLPRTNRVTIRVYPPQTQPYGSADEFETVFTKVVGHFGQHGTDTEHYQEWLNGNLYRASQI